MAVTTLSVSRRAVQDALAFVRDREREKRAHANDVRQTAWQHHTAHTPGAWPFWRHGFAGRYGARVERADFTVIPGYDVLAQEMAALFPEYADDDGCERLWSFLLSPYDCLPTREDMLEEAIRLAETRAKEPVVAYTGDWT